MTDPDTTALWSEFHRPLGAFLAKRVRRPSDVDDLLQEVFVRIHKRIDTIERAERLDAWIFQIARNALIDFERVRATRNDGRQTGADELDALPQAQPEDRPSELATCMRPMIATLPEPYRETSTSSAARARWRRSPWASSPVPCLPKPQPSWRSTARW